MTRPQKISLGLTLIGIVGLRLALLPQGFYYFQDELRYRFALGFVRELSSLRFYDAGRQLFEFYLYGRPGMVLVDAIPAALQAILLLVTGIKTETPASLLIPKLFGFIAAMLLVILVFRLSRRYVSFGWSLLISIVYALLVNTNLYVRHVVPYDIALAIYMGTLVWVLLSYKTTSQFRLAVVAAVGSMAGFLIYPTYYLFNLAVGLLLVCLGKHWFKRGIIFGAVSVTILLLVDMLSKLLGKAYISDLIYTTNAAVLGSHKETFIFLMRYLWQVEGLVGKLLVFTNTWFLVTLPWKWKKYPREFVAMYISFAAAYLFHAVWGYTTGKVYYGRGIHLFYPVLVMGTGIFLASIRRTWQLIGGGGLFLALLLSLLSWYPQYLRIDYPKDILFSYCQADCNKQVLYVKENLPAQIEAPVGPANSDFLAINFGNLYPPDEKTYPYLVPKNAIKLWESPHPINFLAYQFEWHTPVDRELLQRHRFMMRLYRLP